MFVSRIRRFGRLALCLACLALAFGSKTVQGGSLLYLGLFDGSGNTTLLGQYDVGKIWGHHT